MNHRYQSDAIVCDGTKEPTFEKDAELHHQPTTWPGARVPHVWVFDDAGNKVSTLDLCGNGEFTILTGIGGDVWEAAAQAVSKKLNVKIAVHKIGPRQRRQDFSGEWDRVKEVRDGGALLVSPDHHVAWRADAASPGAEADFGYCGIDRGWG